MSFSNHQSADTFGDVAVFWKQATGSEGATVDITTPDNSTECSSWYHRFTGYDPTTPVACTAVAWADSLTQDPPSQSVASAPRDFVALAFAHNRGDNTWSSGPGMTLDSHLNSSLAVGRTVGIGRQAYTAQSSAIDPSAVVFAGTTRLGSAVTCFVYATATASQVSLSSGPFKRLLKGKL